MNARSSSLSVSLVIAAVVLSACQGGLNEQQTVAAAQADIDKQDYKSAVIHTKNVLQKNGQNAEARRLLGQALLETGSAADSAVELRKALELNANESKTVPLLAKALLAQGDASQVVLQFAATRLSDAASSADLKTTLATAYAAQGDRDSAMQTVQSALQEWPQHAPATLLLARLMAADGKGTEALTKVEQVLAQDPKNAAALTLKGDLLRYVQHDNVAALAAYRAAAAANPRAMVAHAAIIGMLLDQNDINGAKAQLALLAAAHPDHPETHLLQARVAFFDKDYGKTREIAGRLLKFYPNDVRVLQLAGAAELRLNSLAQAENFLGQAAKAAPRALAPRQLLAQVYMRTGQPQKALEILQPILASNAPDAASVTLSGQAKLLAGDVAGSEAAFARAAKIDPKDTMARTALAVGQLAKGHTAEGYAELEALSASESDTRADMVLITARLRNNDPEGALKAVDALEKKQPGTALAQVLRGNIQMRRKDNAAATAAFEKALAIDPLYFPATAGLASLDLSAGHPEDAERRFEALLQKDPKNYRAMLGLAEAKTRMGSPQEEVTKSLVAATKASPSEPTPRLLLVRYLLSQNDTKGALAAAQDAAAAQPNSLELLEQLGVAQLAEGQAQQAVTTFSRLAAARPDRPEPQLRLAEAYVASKDLAAARQSLDRALQMQAGLASAQRMLAQVDMLQKRHAEALEIAHAMQRAQPKVAAGYLLEADIEVDRGRPDAAIAALRLALPLGGTEAAVRLHRTLAASGRNDEAGRFATQWRKDHPQDAVFLFYLGDTALTRRDWASAEALYRSVSDLQPGNAIAINNVAWLMLRQQKPGALSWAERANKLLPHRTALMDTLASALAEENQAPKAIEVQKQAIAQAPNDAGLRLTLAKIYLKIGARPQAKTELETLAKLGDKFPDHGEVADLMKSL